MDFIEGCTMLACDIVTTLVQLNDVNVGHLAGNQYQDMFSVQFLVTLKATD